MKIHPDQIEGVRQSQDQNKANKAAKPQQAFGDVLGQEVGKAGAAQAPGAAIPPPGVNPLSPLIAPQAVQKVQPSASEGEAVAQAERALGTLEDYAGMLGAPQADLRQAYAALEDLQSDVAQLKGMAQEHPGLKEVANELEVLALTEQVKFNRGDYH